MNISKFIDYTLQKEAITKDDIFELCEHAKQNKLYAVCVHSDYVLLCKQLLLETNVKICAIVGDPHGNTSTKSKIEDAQKAIENGANEIDLTLNLEDLKKRNYIAVLKDICDVKLAINKIPLKVCIEISKLSKNEIIKACEICIDAKINYIKTSNTFNKSSATLTAVKIIKKTVRGNIKIKAAGDINDYAMAIKYLDAGAERLGTSTILKLEDETRQIKNSKIYKQYLEAKEKKNTPDTKTSESLSKLKN